MPTASELEGHRETLNALCVRMLGSGSDADDAVQEALVRAWRSIERFDGRSSLGTQLSRQQSVRLAFVAALQHLPAKQRAVLLLSEVLGWSAAEIAEAIDASVASVNSAMQRARATLNERVPGEAPSADGLSDAQQRRLGRHGARLGRQAGHRPAGPRLHVYENLLRPGRPPLGSDVDGPVCSPADLNGGAHVRPHFPARAA